MVEAEHLLVLHRGDHFRSVVPVGHREDDVEDLQGDDDDRGGHGHQGRIDVGDDDRADDPQLPRAVDAPRFDDLGGNALEGG